MRQPGDFKSLEDFQEYVRREAVSPFRGADDYVDGDVFAIQALAKGVADGDQQIRALRWIVENACQYYEVGYMPGSGGDRDTSFFEGRRWVGRLIMKMTKLNVASMQENPNGGRSIGNPRRYAHGEQPN